MGEINVEICNGLRRSWLRCGNSDNHECRVPNFFDPAPTPSMPTASDQVNQSIFENHVNPVSGLGCDGQCLPILQHFQILGNGRTSLEAYNQTFGISNVRGIIKKESTSKKISHPYMPGRHGRSVIAVEIPDLPNGAHFETCMAGEIESSDTPITWRTSYQYNFNENYIFNLQRVSPVTFETGDDAGSC